MIWAWNSPPRALASFLLLMAPMLCAAAVVAQPMTPEATGVWRSGSSAEQEIASDLSGRLMASIDSTVIQPGLKTFLEPNFPNPFSASTTIAYTLAEETVVELKVYDFMYREMVTLVNGERQPPGRYVIRFLPLGLPSAMYFYKLRTSQGVELRRMLYVK